MNKNESVDLTIIVISNLKRPDYLGKCLNSLNHLNPGSQFEVLIITSEPNSFDVQPWKRRGLRIRNVTASEDNYCYKRNLGAREARANIVTYIDDDTIVTPDWASAIVRGFHAQWKIAGGRVIPIFEAEIPEKLKGYERYIGGFNYLPTERYISKTIIGCNMFLERDFLLRSGGFDEYIGRMNNVTPRIFYGGDETELISKLKKEQIGFIEEAVISHVIQSDRMSYEYFLRRAMGLGRMRCYIDIKSGIKRYNIMHRWLYLIFTFLNRREKINYLRHYNYILGYLSYRSSH